MTFLADLASLCSVHSGVLRGGLIPGLFLLGLAGSAIHCLPMCGPFVLGQVADRMACLDAGCLSERHRMQAGLLTPYHLGRLLTYSGLGALAGSIGTQAMKLGEHAAGALLLIAAALFLMLAMNGARASSSGAWGRTLARAAARLSPGRAGNGFALGMLLGLLPCGFLYAALFAASAAGSAGFGALAMAAFGVGTVPALAGLGVAGQAVGRWRPRTLAALRPWVLGANAALLAILGLLTLAA